MFHRGVDRHAHASRPKQLFSLLRDGNTDGAALAVSTCSPAPKTIEAVVGLVAEESGAHPSMLLGALSPSPLSRARRRHRAASDTRVLNLGKQRVSFETAEGYRCGLPSQIAEVERSTVEMGRDLGDIANLTTGARD